MLLRLVLKTWAQAIFLPWPPKVLDYRHKPLRLANHIIFQMVEHIRYVISFFSLETACTVSRPLL